mmetsp:Transcript_28369/g.96549  ORF Transcript_28369/g.96549 Transcript_28369/m.96549 type:complete len:235 (+) Transcript_28369:338-1042(+)
MTRLGSFTQHVSVWSSLSALPHRTSWYGHSPRCGSRPPVTPFQSHRWFTHLAGRMSHSLSCCLSLRACSSRLHPSKLHRTSLWPHSRLCSSMSFFRTCFLQHSAGLALCGSPHVANTNWHAPSVSSRPRSRHVCRHPLASRRHTTSPVARFVAVSPYLHSIFSPCTRACSDSSRASVPAYASVSFPARHRLHIGLPEEYSSSRTGSSSTSSHAGHRRSAGRSRAKAVGTRASSV